MRGVDENDRILALTEDEAELELQSVLDLGLDAPRGEKA